MIMELLSFFVLSGYGSQAVSSNTLSSDDSMSLRSISVDGTPDTESLPKVTNISDPDQLKHPSSKISNNIQSSNNSDLLSPPDISLTSISPGEETDTTVTVETTPSSANITPSQSSEWPPQSKIVMHTSHGVSFTNIQVLITYLITVLKESFHLHVEHSN